MRISQTLLARHFEWKWFGAALMVGLLCMLAIFLPFWFGG